VSLLGQRNDDCRERTTRPERFDRQLGRLPDPFGVALLAGGIALVTDAIVQTDSWGWASTKFAVALLLAAVVLGSFIYRCNTVGNPVIHLGLFKANNFRWANMTMIVFAIGFNAMFLGNVLFLTRVWGYSILKAGLAISVGPLIVIAFATGLTAADALDGFHHI
jgi:hypothetical protein